METINKTNLVKELPVGLEYQGSYIKEVELLRSNGIAEKVFSEKMPDNPYTWMARVLTIGLKRIGEHPVGLRAREQYLKTRDFDIPDVVKQLSMADQNTLLLEIHRTVWQNLLPKQECLCKYCGGSMIIDVDLNRIEMDEETKTLVQTTPEWRELVCDMQGFEFIPLGHGDKQLGVEFAGIIYNRFVFRVPTIHDSLKVEKFYSDTIIFWRKLAAACLEHVYRVEEGGQISSELPLNIVHAMGQQLFDLHLDSADLGKIRHTLREELPTMPFSYEEACVNPRCMRHTPVTIEAGSFFSA